MKRSFTILAICLTACILLTGCAAGGSGGAAALALPTPSATPVEEPADQPIIGMPNPIVTVDSYAKLLEGVPGTLLADAPSGAENVVYSYITGIDPIISQIQFTLAGNEYTYRAAAASESAQSDISGIYEDLSKTAQLTAESNVTAGGEYTLRYAPGETKGLATWYYTPTQCQYSLYTPTGCDISQAIEEVVDLLLPIATDADGNPLPGLSNTPLPTVEEGVVSGVVVEIQQNDIVINTANGNTLQFLLTHVAQVDAKVGDTVEITYSGNVIDAPEAITITVTKAAPQQRQVYGTVVQYSKTGVFIQTTTVNVYGFVINADTRFTGLSSTLKQDNAVTITYTGELTNGPVATEIETTAVSSKPEPTEKPEPINKSLKGYVTSLTTKRVSVTADSGHTYTFQRDGSTIMTGDYMLEVGSRVRVHYDGYASNSPLAKRIEVLAPPDPTPPSPVTRTITGTVTMQAGNALVVMADSGAEYSFLLRAPTVIGSGGVGDRVTVTFTDDGYGGYNVTRLVYDTPIVYDAGPGPVIDSPGNDDPILATGSGPAVSGLGID